MKFKMAVKGAEKLSKLKEVAKIGYTNAKFLAARKGPKWGVYAGLATMAVGAGWLAYKTLKLEETVDKATKDISAAKETGDKKEVTKAYMRAVRSFVYLYGGPVLVMTGGGTLVLKCVGILNSRFLVVEAALAATQKEYGDYQNKVIEYVGPEVEAKIRHGLHDEVAEIERKNPETGEMEKVKDIVPVMDGNHVPNDSDIICTPDQLYSTYYDKNLMEWIRHLQTGYAAAKRFDKIRGYIFKNEILNFMGWLPNSLAPDGWGNGHIEPNKDFPNERDVQDWEVRVANMGNKPLDEITITDVYTYLQADKLQSGVLILSIDGMRYISDRVEKYLSHDKKY